MILQCLTLTRKIISNMTYNVFGGTLNPTLLCTAMGRGNHGSWLPPIIVLLYYYCTVILRRKIAAWKNWYYGEYGATLSRRKLIFRRNIASSKKLILRRKWRHPLETKIGSGIKTCGLNTVTARPKFSQRLGLVPGTTYGFIVYLTGCRVTFVILLIPALTSVQKTYVYLINMKLYISNLIIKIHIFRPISQIQLSVSDKLSTVVT